MIKDQMENIYTSIPPDEIPWNMETPPEVLRQLVEKKVITPCKVIELGCGIGNYVIYLARNGFTAAGVDISKSAIELARQTADKKGVEAHFIVADVLGDISKINGPFDFIYDWELLHHIFPEDREKYIANVDQLLKPGGTYLSVCFSEDSPQFGGKGKYRKTPLDTVLYFSCEREIQSLFDTKFQIEEIKTIDVQGKFSPHRAIYAFLQKSSSLSDKL